MRSKTNASLATKVIALAINVMGILLAVSSECAAETLVQKELLARMEKSSPAIQE